MELARRHTAQNALNPWLAVHNEQTPPKESAVRRPPEQMPPSVSESTFVLRSCHIRGTIARVVGLEGTPSEAARQRHDIFSPGVRLLRRN